MNNSSSQQTCEILESNETFNDYKNAYYYSALIPKHNKRVSDLAKSCRNPRCCFIGFERKCKCILLATNSKDKSKSGYFLIEIVIDKKNCGNVIIFQFMVDNFFKLLKLSNNVAINRISYVFTSTIREKSSEKQDFSESPGRVYNIEYVCETLQRNLQIKHVNSFRTTTTFWNFPLPPAVIQLNGENSNPETYDKQVFYHVKRNAKSIIESFYNAQRYSDTLVVPPDDLANEIAGEAIGDQVKSQSSIVAHNLYQPGNFGSMEVSQNAKDKSSELKKNYQNVRKCEKIINHTNSLNKEAKSVKPLKEPIRRCNESKKYFLSHGDSTQHNWPNSAFLPNYNNSEGLNHAIEVEDSGTILAEQVGAIESRKKFQEINNDVEQKEIGEPTVNQDIEDFETDKSLNSNKPGLDNFVIELDVRIEEIEEVADEETLQPPDNQSEQGKDTEIQKSDVPKAPELLDVVQDTVRNDLNWIVESARTSINLIKQSSVVEILKSISANNPELEKTVSKLIENIDKNDETIVEMSQFLLVAGMPSAEIEKRVLNCLENETFVVEPEEHAKDLNQTASDIQLLSNKSEEVLPNVSEAGTQVISPDPPKRFRESVLYRTITAKYSECIGSSPDSYENANYSEFKRKTYSVLQEIKRKTRAEKFCRGNDRFSHGFCLDESHSGSVLDRLITSTFLQNNTGDSRVSSKKGSLQKMLSENVGVTPNNLSDHNPLHSKISSMRNSQEILQGSDEPLLASPLEDGPQIDLAVENDQMQSTVPQRPSWKSDDPKSLEKQGTTGDSLNLIDLNALLEERKTLSANDLNRSFINDVIVKTNDILLRSQPGSMNEMEQEVSVRTDYDSFPELPFLSPIAKKYIEYMKDQGISDDERTCFKKKQYEVLKELVRQEKIKNVSKGCNTPGMHIDRIYTGSPLERLINECIQQSNNDNTSENSDQINFDDFESQYHEIYADNYVDNPVSSIDELDVSSTVDVNASFKEVPCQEKSKMTFTQNFEFQSGDQLTCYANNDPILSFVIDDVSPTQQNDVFLTESHSSPLCLDRTNLAEVCRNYSMNRNEKELTVTSESRCSNVTFKESSFYKSVLEKYALWINEKSLKDGNWCFQFKNRDYENLQRLIKMQKLRRFCKGMSERKLGFCMNRVYNGCFLEKLITDNQFLKNVDKTIKKDRRQKWLQRYKSGVSTNSLEMGYVENTRETTKSDNTSKSTYVRSPTDFEKTLFYQSVVTNYALCLDKEVDYDSDLTGTRYKNRDFQNLRIILHKQRLKSLFKGTDRRRLGIFFDGMYKGSRLEKLIYKSFVRYKNLGTDDVIVHSNEVKVIHENIVDNETVNIKTSDVCGPETITHLSDLKNENPDICIQNPTYCNIGSIISSGDNNKIRRKLVIKHEQLVYHYVDAINPRPCLTPVENGFEEWTIYDTLPQISHNIANPQLFRGDGTDGCVIIKPPDELLYNPGNNSTVYLAEVHSGDGVNQDHKKLKSPHKDTHRNFKNKSFNNKFGETRFVFDFTKTANEKIIKFDLLHSWKVNKMFNQGFDDIEYNQDGEQIDNITISFKEGGSNPGTEVSSNGSLNHLNLKVSSEEHTNATIIADHDIGNDALLHVSYKMAADLTKESDTTKLKISCDRTSTNTSRVFDVSSTHTDNGDNVVHVMVTIDECYSDSTNVNPYMPVSPYEKYLIQIQETPAVVTATENESEVFVMTEQSVASDVTKTVDVNKELILESCSSTLSSDERVRKILIESLAIKELELNKRYLSIGDQKSKYTLAGIDTTNHNTTNGNQHEIMSSIQTKGWASRFDIILRQIMFKSQFTS